MPATFVSSQGTTMSVWITWLDSAELKQMNATEGVGTLYSYGVLSRARLDAPGPAVTRPGLYVDCWGALQLGGRILAIRSVPARHRRVVAVNSAGALSRVAPAIGWRGSVFDLLLDNVRFPGRRASRSKILEALSGQPAEPGYEPIHSSART